ANAAVAQLVAGRWLKTPTTGSFASLAKFADRKALFDALLSPTGTLVRGRVTTLRGRRVVPVTDEADGGTLYVAATGPPYPVELVNRAKHATLVFDGIDAPVHLTAPKGAIDLRSLEGG